MACRRGAAALFVVLVVAFLLLAAAIAEDCSKPELAALVAFRQNVLVSSNELRSSWSRNSSSCCEWIGVNCSDVAYSESGVDYIVEGIALPGRKLKGNLGAARLGDLRGLRHLDLSNNGLSGYIAENLSTLPRLQFLDLSSNNLSGSIRADDSSSFPAAVHLNLSSNRFSGSLPSSSLGGIALRVLDLSNNFFSGRIPSQPCSSSSSSQLTALNYSSNMISGGIPLGLTKCTRLQAFQAEDNGLEGPIPVAVADMQSLRVLKLSFNKLNGSIPREFGSLKQLRELWLDKNSLDGTIPEELSGCSSLEVLSVRDNGLLGPISLNCSNLNELVYLDLSYNTLSGEIPGSLHECSKLGTLALTGNALDGEIPPELGRLKRLTTLMLSKNNLVGRVPEELQGCSSLLALVLSKNYFTGELMPGSNVSGFRSLQLLAVGNSNLSGEVPLWLRNCSKLQVLDMSWNRLKGEVPSWLGELEHLFYLDLSNNSLSGGIPSELSDLAALSRAGDLKMDDLKPVSSILFVKHRNNMTRLQYNQVSALPPTLLLSSNLLEGEIPPRLGMLKKLVCLDVANNRMSGGIPESLGNLSDLEALDLSGNALSGRIPTSLVNLFSLSRLNLSYNLLSGPIPSGFQFSTFNAWSYVGNLGLCGYPLQNCGIGSVESTDGLKGRINGGSGSGSGKMKSMVIGLSLSLGLGISGMGIGLWIWLLSTKRAVHHRDDEEEGFTGDEEYEEAKMSEVMQRTVFVFHNRELLKSKEQQQQWQPLTNADLVKATNNFDQSNIVGCGGFGLVFVASLADGSKVAIKRLTGDCLQVEREFEAEVQALAMAEHPNLVTLQGYSSYGNQRLLIYSYMENGSLDFWLHERPDGGQRLDWSTRLDIARGAARGLDYLHSACEPHIVHRDIKSSNILLDDRFVAHVADFGLARLMLPTATHVSTEVVGTLGYIPPEYGQSWMATPRGDVYSFGVVLLELLARRRPLDVCRTNGVSDLIAWVREMRAAGKSGEIFDPLLRGKGVEEEMEAVLEVACLCINPNPQKRPGIQEVVRWLEEVGSSESKTQM